jgi:hypothetical protein
MFYESTRTLSQSIVQCLARIDEVAWDDQIESGGECPYRCLMNGSNHLAEADARPLHLCPVDLHKLQWRIGLDVIDRYRWLSDFHRLAGFDDEGCWVERRIASLLR